MIQPGAKIPLHYHEGTQVSYIDQGTLTYTVAQGGVKVMDGPGDDGEVIRKIKAGQTGKIREGNWIVEQPTTIHRANNFGDDKIVIYLSNLLDKDAAPSTLGPVGRPARLRADVRVACDRHAVVAVDHGDHPESG